MTEKLHRYPGAKPFETSQQNIFFGREKDVEVLCRKLRQEPLTVLYSKSGMGKSSLLNAGVVPAMEAAGEYRCLRIRFSAFNREAPADEQLMPILRCRETVTRAACPALHPEVSGPGDGAGRPAVGQHLSRQAHPR